MTPKARQLVDTGLMTTLAGQIAVIIYGFGGTSLLDRQCSLLLDGQITLWQRMSRLVAITNRMVSYRYAVDPVNRITFCEFDYTAGPDSLPLESAAATREMFINATTFEVELYNLVTELPRFG
ncbi:hypothetical protein [Mycobacterium uberis]|uniref:hypothetical protein n=1 Tax=Mycobacterium uberis TaxID=2162698 RepID=UPI0014023827|nr:hypothetical protein [Mycobacterium uberis]